MGVFDPSVGGDPGCGSLKGKGLSPSSIDGDGGLGLGQEGRCRAEPSYKGDAVFNRSHKSPTIKDPELGSQGSESLLRHLRLG